MSDAQNNRQYDEAWWERELFRNEKLLDRYMAAFSGELDLSSWNPFLEANWAQETGPEAASENNTNHQVNDNYQEIAQQARNFAFAAVALPEPFPKETHIFQLAAGKIVNHLTAGHNLGYDAESICGNIVKCRWALSDAIFCGDMLELWQHQHPREEHRILRMQSEHLIKALRLRVARLRLRVRR